MACKALRAALALLITTVAASASTTPTMAQEMTGPKRLALVIGNSAYQNVARLTNPVNDATDIAAKLKTLQFVCLVGHRRGSDSNGSAARRVPSKGDARACRARLLPPATASP